MKLDLVKQGGDSGFEIIRISAFTKEELTLLMRGLDQMISENSLDTFKLESSADASAELTFHLFEREIGILVDSVLKNDLTAYCFLTKAQYIQMIRKLKLFIENEMEGYIWLYDLDVPIELLLSHGGGW